MKLKYQKKAGCILGMLLLTWWSASGETNAPAGLLGDWANKDFQTRSITRVQIRQDGGRVSVHVWGRCHPSECDWGDATATVNGHSLSVTWNVSFAVRTQTLTLQADGNLQVSVHTHFIDNSGRKDIETEDTLAKGLVHEWSDPVPK